MCAPWLHALVTLAMSRVRPQAVAFTRDIKNVRMVACIWCQMSLSESKIYATHCISNVWMPCCTVVCRNQTISMRAEGHVRGVGGAARCSQCSWTWQINILYRVSCNVS